MYVNKIEDLLDKIIDDFYNKVILKKDINKYFDQIDFVKYQLDINKLFVAYMENLDKKDIDAILDDETATLKFLEIVKKYIAYYVFMTFAYYYKGKYESYINNVIEFSKNQPSFSFKIVNFFNSESNSKVISFYKLIKNILIILDADSVKLSQLQKNPEFVEVRRILNELGQEYVDNKLRLKNLNGKLSDQAHNIIKILLLTELYIKEDKKDVHEFLEKNEMESADFIYIDVVLPKSDFIDYNMIEQALSIEDVERGLAADIYDLITSATTDSDKDKNQDEKILELLNREIFVPISEDFLLYHKDSEKYEKSLGTSNSNTQTKKKDETKIKYIINKIDSVSEYFSQNVKDKPELRKNTEKLFYQPLSERRAILVNNNEDVKILNKFQNQGRRAIENNEYYHDLLNYKKYPYINFKDFQKYGFNISPTKTLDAVRSINFEKANENRKNRPIQVRIGSQDQSLNIVGFIIPSKKNDIKCLNIRDFIDIRKIGYKEQDKIEKKTNGYINAIKILKRILFNKKNIPSVYWIFDTDRDVFKLDKYETSTKLTTSDHLKSMTSAIYDELMIIAGDEIIKYINKKQFFTLQQFDTLMKHIDKYIISFPQFTDIYNELFKTVYYEKIYKTIDSYDKREDTFHGLLGDYIKLPIAPSATNKNIPVIKLTKNKKKVDIMEIDMLESEKYSAICQHNVDWDNISALRKKNPNKFSELLFEFFQQYVVKNYEGDFVCKSCGILVDIKNYVIDGSYDSDGRFVSFSIQMDIPIEDIPGYEKYKTSIRNMEKIVEKVASITNVKSLTGATTTIKGRIRRIIKDAVDLLVVHNANLKNIYRERSEKISVYGLSKELSNLFIFELDNSIFLYSSKDKDTYKFIKRNNILVYLLFLIIIELSDSQIYFMTGDKICNYYLFNKYGENLFNGIQIRKNNQNTITPILNYKVLCYIIFYMSCLLTKYNLWQTESNDSKKFNPTIQKAIIHTLVDFINSVIEIYSKKKKNFIYDNVANKFFQKLDTTFKNNDILDRINNIEKRKIVVEDKKAKIISGKVKSIPLAHEYTEADYLGTSEWIVCKPARDFVSRRKNNLIKYDTITNITNCIQGTFHDWKVNGKSFSCKICGVFMSDVKDNKELNKEILENYTLNQIKKVANKYCKSKQLHNFVYDSKINCKICTNCHLVNINDLTDNELNEINQNINLMKAEIVKKQKDIKNKEIQVEKSQEEQNKEFVNLIKSQYAESKKHKDDYYNFVDQFIKLLESIIGKDVNINNQNVFLRYDSYIINHNHEGNKLDKPFTIVDDGSKIIYKKDHPFFKKDVIYYTNYKLQMDIYYDAVTKLLLGYKEKNKEYQRSKIHNVYLITNSSVMNMIKMLGYPSKYIKIKEKINFNQEIYRNKLTSLIYVISEISRDRISKLKKAITDLQRYIFRIFYNYDAPNINNEIDNNDKFMEKYKNKLNNLVTKDKNDKFLMNWKIINENLFFESIRNKTINLDPSSEFLLFEDISNYDYNGNVILYYIVNGMQNLLDFNDDKIIKTTLCYLLIDIIIRIHNEFNQEKLETNTEITRFKYTLELTDTREIETFETEGFYEEYKDPDAIVDEATEEANYDDREEMEALDMEEELDYEIDYESGTNISG